MPLNLTAQPNPSAVAHLAAKTPVASILRSAEWAYVPVALSERAQRSAGVESVRFLQTVQDKVMKVVSLQRERLANGKEAFVTRDSFIADLRQVAREEGIGGPGPGLSSEGRPTAGALTDVQSSARLGLIYDMQREQALGFASWKIGQDRDVLDAFPAQELIRVESRRMHRDWQSRWIAAGGELVSGGPAIAGGRMIALKTDPIWENISIFGTPWPPFDWGSGMGLRDVSRKEAMQLGLLEPTDRIEPSEAGFNSGLAAGVDVANIAEPFIAALKKIFGAKIQIQGNKLAWA